MTAAQLTALTAGEAELMGTKTPTPDLADADDLAGWTGNLRS